MKCPLLRHAEISSGVPYLTEGSECLTDKCACWDNTAGKCAILQLTFELDELHCWLEKLVEKMPHAGQFLK